MAGALAGAAAVGALAGSRLGVRVPGERLGQGFAVLVFAVAVFLFVRSIGAIV